MEQSLDTVCLPDHRHSAGPSTLTEPKTSTQFMLDSEKAHYTQQEFKH